MNNTNDMEMTIIHKFVTGQAFNSEEWLVLGLTGALLLTILVLFAISLWKWMND